MMTTGGYVYVMSNASKTLYVGVMADLERRVWQHKHRQGAGFTRRYNCTLLVFFEEYGDIRDAIAREKAIKGWTRAKKLALIEGGNPRWGDLSEGWYG
jgi:putative endonuclease